MVLSGTYKSDAFFKLAGEHAAYAISIEYTYHPGLPHIDPQLHYDGELDIECMSAEIADGIHATIDTEYHDGIISQLNPEFNNHLESEWHKHSLDLSMEAAAEKYQQVSGF